MTEEKEVRSRGRKRARDEVDKEVGVLVECTEHQDCPGHSARTARRHREKKRKLAVEPESEASADAADADSEPDDSFMDTKHVGGPASPAASGVAAISANSDSSSEAESDDPSSGDGSDADDTVPRSRGRPKAVIELSKALFEGSACTVVQGIELLLQLQARHKLTDALMADLFDVIRMLLPASNNLITYAVAKRVILELSAAKLEFIDSCVNSCVLFCNADRRFDRDGKRQFGALAACPVCNEARCANDKPRKVCLC
jgi:hypothetical protein